MEYNNLPIKLMKAHLSSPNPIAFDLLNQRGITTYIEKNFKSLADRADAFDGAFVGFYIDLQLSHGGNEEDCLDEVLGYYHLEEFNDPSSPFFDGLKTTLASFNREEFYKKAVDYIIFKKGKLE